MIEIFRQCNTSIYMRFDGKGYEDLLKMLDEILAGKEVALDVVFDMSVIKMKKKAARQRTSIIHVIKDNDVHCPIIYLQDNKVIWKMDAEDADEAIYWLREWKEQGWFGETDIFTCIKVPKNKHTDNMYCILVHPNDSGNGPSIDFPHGKSKMHGQ